MLRRLRRRRSLTVADMAYELDIDVRTYERLATGRTRLDLERLLALAEVLNTDPIGFLAALALNTPAVAYACADAKILLALALALGRLSHRQIEQLSQAHASTVVLVCDQLLADLLADAPADQTDVDRR